MNSLLIAIAGCSAVAIVYILLAWMFSPKPYELERDHLLRVKTLQGSLKLLERLNLKLELISFFLIRHRWALLVLFTALFAVCAAMLII